MTVKYSIVEKDDLHKVINSGDAEFVLKWMQSQKDVSVYRVFDPQYQIYLTVAEFMERSVKEFYKSGMVGKFYKMDPLTEDMLPSGKRLVPGMWVLIASSDPREDVSNFDSLDEWRKNRALETNRWCRVESTPFIDGQGMMFFVGVYSDGVKIQRIYSWSHAWLVKKDGIPDLMSEKVKESIRYHDVYDIVKEALIVESETMDVIERLCDEATCKILGTLG